MSKQIGVKNISYSISSLVEDFFIETQKQVKILRPKRIFKFDKDQMQDLINELIFELDVKPDNIYAYDSAIYQMFEFKFKLSVIRIYFRKALENHKIVFILEKVEMIKYH